MPENAKTLSERWSVHSGGVGEIRYHFAGCPTYRRPVLEGTIANRLKELLQDCMAGLGGEILELAMQPDHVHVFLRVQTPYLSPAQIAFCLKG